MPKGAVNCTRPGRWGNPFKVGSEYEGTDGSVCEVQDVKHSLRCFRYWAVHTIGVEEIRRELAGKDLACFCPLDRPCHVDILLKLANK